jgi:predicted dehydrogenase
MYCEKPTGVSIAESHAMLKAVRDHKRVFRTGIACCSNDHGITE